MLEARRASVVVQPSITWNAETAGTARVSKIQTQRTEGPRRTQRAITLEESATRINISFSGCHLGFSPSSLWPPWFQLLRVFLKHRRPTRNGRPMRVLSISP